MVIQLIRRFFNLLKIKTRITKLEMMKHQGHNILMKSLKDIETQKQTHFKRHRNFKRHRTNKSSAIPNFMRQITR